MPIENEARKLLELKRKLEQTEYEYEEQRINVHNILVNSVQQYIEIDGFKISKVYDYAQLIFNRDLLKQQLRNDGLTDEQINGIIARSKEERTVPGANCGVTP